jgi:hypothetical protein
MAHNELSVSSVTKKFMDNASLIGSKEDYNIYFICNNINPNSHKFEPTIITSKYNLKLVTVYPPVSIDVNFNQSFDQKNLYSKIIEELDIKELSKNGNKFFDEFFIRVNNPSGNKHIYLFLKKNTDGAAAATSAFYKKKSMKKKSLKKKSLKKKSLKKKSLKKKSLKKKF